MLLTISQKLKSVLKELDYVQAVQTQAKHEYFYNLKKSSQIRIDRRENNITFLSSNGAFIKTLGKVTKEQLINFRDNEEI